MRRDAAPNAPSTPVGGLDAQGCPILTSDRQGLVGRPAPGEVCWTAQDVPMTDLVGLIEQPAGRPIVDATGLAGRYDFKIRFEMSGRRTGDAVVAASSAPSIFAAVEEQLGLKLESTNAPLDQLIIDAIDREPTEN